MPLVKDGLTVNISANTIVRRNRKAVRSGIHVLHSRPACGPFRRPDTGAGAGWSPVKHDSRIDAREDRETLKVTIVEVSPCPIVSRIGTGHAGLVENHKHE